MEFKSKSKLRDEKRAAQLVKMEADRRQQEAAEKERFASIDDIVQALENLIAAKIAGCDNFEKTDLRNTIVEAIKNIGKL